MSYIELPDYDDDSTEGLEGNVTGNFSEIVLNNSAVITTELSSNVTDSVELQSAGLDSSACLILLIVLTSLALIDLLYKLFQCMKRSKWYEERNKYEINTADCDSTGYDAYVTGVCPTTVSGKKVKTSRFRTSTPVTPIRGIAEGR